MVDALRIATGNFGQDFGLCSSPGGFRSRERMVTFLQLVGEPARPRTRLHTVSPGGHNA